MKFYREFYLLVSALISAQVISKRVCALSDSNITTENNPVEFPGSVIDSIIRLNKNQIAHESINVTAINVTLELCVYKIHVVTDVIKNQRIHATTTGISTLRSTIRDVFDLISQATNSLENALKEVDSCVDLINDVQVALQVMIDTFVSSNCDELVDIIQTSSKETTFSSIYCLTKAMKFFLRTTSYLTRKLTHSNEIVDINVLSGIQVVVQSILNIVNTVVQGLKSIQALDTFSTDPSFLSLSLTIETLANQQININTNIADTAISSLSTLADTLQPSIGHIAFITHNNIGSLIEFILISPLQELSELSYSMPAVAVVLNALQANLTAMSNSVHSIQNITNSVTYCSDTSMENLVVTIKCLTYYISNLPINLLIREFHEMIQPNFQTILLLIASNIQTMTDEINLVVEKSLNNLICASSRTDKNNFKNQFIELQSLIEPTILILENIIKSSIMIVRDIMAWILAIENHYPAYDRDVYLLYSSIRRFINDVNRILNDITKYTSILHLDNTAQISTNEIVLTNCKEAFEEVVQNYIKLRVYFYKSIEQIQIYLLE